MARAKTVTLLSLDRYAEIMGLDPRHFNQAVAAAVPATAGCDEIWYQYAWMNNDRASREDLARAISNAERMIADYVGFWPAPTWTEGEWKNFPKQRVVWNGTYPNAFLSLRTDTYKTVKTRWAKVLRGGRKEWSLLESGAAVTYSDPYGLGLDDIAEVDITYDTSTHDDILGSEVRVVPAGTATEDLDRYSLRGLSATFTAPNNCHIEGNSSKFIDPDLWEQQNPIDADAAASFLPTVDVYRLWTSVTGEDNAAALLGWQDICNLDTATEGICQYGTEYACILLVLPDRGTIAPVPATWSDTSQSWVRQVVTSEPDLCRVWYLSGYPWDEFGEMAHPLDRAVAALATALLAKPICACGNAERMADHWREIPENASFEQLENPFGPQNGAYLAYLTVRQLMPLHGSSV